jgi:CcmD family protein
MKQNKLSVSMEHITAGFKVWRKSTKVCLSLLFFLLASTNLFAQSDVEMADTMRSEGKIYVVVVVIAVVLIGLLAYLFRLDRKVSKLERETTRKS